MKTPRGVGDVHLPPLPGFARGGSVREMATVIDRVRANAAANAAEGVDALILENSDDAPVVAGNAGPHVVAAMTLPVAAVLAETAAPVGGNVLRNDVLAAVAIAANAGASFVRANVYVGAAPTDQGIVQGRAEEVQRPIRHLDARIPVGADIDVKHAAPPAPRPLADSAVDAVERGLSEAVIVSGSATGRSASGDDLPVVGAALPGTPPFVGSGATAANVVAMLGIADSVIVGTAVERDGVVSAAVDSDRVRTLVAAAAAASSGRAGRDGGR